MILQRLYELAVTENLLADLAFDVLPVPYLVLVGEGGEYLGFSDIRGTTTIQSKAKRGAPKPVPDNGRLLKVPRSVVAASNKGAARYFVDTLPRVLPLVVEAEDQGKVDASRKTFWEQIKRAADETDDQALRAVQAFGRRLDEFTDRIRADVAKEKPVDGARVTFAYQPNGGPTLLDLEPVRKWYARFYREVSANRQEAGPVGVCQVTGTVGPIMTTHEFNFQGVPNGHQKGVKLISFNQAAFRHYGLEKAENAGLSYEATDGYQRALEALLKNALPTIEQRGGKSKFVVGGTAFLYWTKEPRDAGFMSLVDDPVSDPMKVLFESLTSGKNAADVVDAEPFYMLALSANDVRAVVRGYLETELGKAKANVAKWFHNLCIADTSKEYSGSVNAKYPLEDLTLATAFDSKSVAPDTGQRLLFAALWGQSVPDSVLVACLRRLAVEGSGGFRAFRMALIKLILIRKGVPVEKQLDPGEKHPAYVYGRLLAVFEQIQYAALGAVNANVVDKFYATASTAPAMVIGRLQGTARKHLGKLRRDKPGLCVVLERRLMEVLDLLGATPPPSRLPLVDQGRFALGYYHEKAKRFEEAANAQGAEADADETN